MALDDLLVLDLSHALAGPFATTMLADFGAEVIKIEAPGTGDMAREWGPPFYEAQDLTGLRAEASEDGSGLRARTPREAAYFVNLHRNKKSVAIDLKKAEGKALFFRLVERADIVIENLRIGTVQKLGVDYERVRERNPRAIYCSISGFGQDGPYRNRAAFDLVVQAESGMISVTGPPGGPGVRAGVSIADITAGMFAAFGIMTALHARTRTGRGQFIDVSMLEGQMSIMSGLFGAYFCDGVVPGPWGTAYAALLPYQTFRTRTRDIAIGVGSDKLWRIFCPLLGLPDMTDDPRYVTNAERVANRESMVQRLQAQFLTKTYEEWEAILLPAGVPMGAVNTIDRVVEHPQVAARGAFETCEHPVAGRVRTVGPPVRLSETPGSVRIPAPLLGQHTEEVLRRMLDVGGEELRRLRDTGAIG
jgi:crotonobetainyl-CoA:carnitine CoA-transferase CaiB-like acyl-CoA transferase